MAMTGSLLVTPEKLIGTSEEFKSTMAQVTTLTTSMMDLVHSMKGAWEGEASTAFQNKFNELQDDIQRIANMINEHVNDLNDIAQVYQKAEAKGMEISNSLSGNVL